MRARLARQPARMHRELRELGSAGPHAAPTQSASSTAWQFAEMVEAELDGGVLRYARRRSLLAKAETLGIPAFHANLLIAAVQHQRKAAGAGDETVRHAPEPRRITALAPVLLVVAVESLVALGAWQVLAG